MPEKGFFVRFDFEPADGKKTIDRIMTPDDSFVFNQYHRVCIFEKIRFKIVG